MGDSLNFQKTLDVCYSKCFDVINCCICFLLTLIVLQEVRRITCSRKLIRSRFTSFSCLLAALCGGAELHPQSRRHRLRKRLQQKHYNCIFRSVNLTLLSSSANKMHLSESLMLVHPNNSVHSYQIIYWHLLGGIGTMSLFDHENIVNSFKNMHNVSYIL